MNILNKLLNKFGKIKIIIFLIIILLFALYMFKTSRDLKVRYIDLEFEDLPKSFDNIKVALASDIHSGLYVSTSHIKKMSYMIMTNNPDIILFVGDYIYSAPRWFRYYNKKNIIKLNEGIKDLNAPLGKYAVMGNHDNYESKIDISNTFCSNNFKMLDNNIIFITNENKEYINSFDKVVIYYDNGQETLATILDTLFVSYPNVERRIDFDHKKKRLFQVLDMLTVIDKLDYKRKNNIPFTKAEKYFFNGKDFRHIINLLKNKRL